MFSACITNCSLYGDEQGEATALIMAAEKGCHECVSILVTNGADVDRASEVKTGRQWEVEVLV